MSFCVPVMNVRLNVNIFSFHKRKKEIHKKENIFKKWHFFRQKRQLGTSRWSQPSDFFPRLYIESSSLIAVLYKRMCECTVTFTQLFIFRLKTVDLCTCECFLILNVSCLSASQNAVFNTPQRLCNCTILFLDHILKGFFCIFVCYLSPHPPPVSVNCRRWLCANRKPCDRGVFSTFGQRYGFVGRILEIRF